MSLYFVIPFLLLIAILQSTLAPRLSVGEGRPDLMLLVIVAWSLRRGMTEGIVWAFCGGLLMDLFSGAPMGTSALALIGVAWVTGLVRDSMVRSRAALPWVMAALATLIYYGLVLLVLSLTGRPVDLRATMLHHALPVALYNVVIVILIYRLMTWLDRRTGPPELRW